MIQPATGSIFDSKASTLVNPVNCEGVMGKGLALEFKKRYPENFTAYAEWCRSGKAKPGTCLMVTTSSYSVMNFATKDKWREPSRLEWIEAGLESMLATLEQLRKSMRAYISPDSIDTVAMPALGCGLGGLDWAVVRPLIEAKLEPVPNVLIYLYGP